MTGGWREAWPQAQGGAAQAGAELPAAGKEQNARLQAEAGAAAEARAEREAVRKEQGARTHAEAGATAQARADRAATYAELEVACKEQEAQLQADTGTAA